MIPRLVPEISPLDAFSDGRAGAGAAAGGNGDSRKLIVLVNTIQPVGGGVDGDGTGTVVVGSVKDFLSLLGDNSDHRWS